MPRVFQACGFERDAVRPVPGLSWFATRLAALLTMRVRRSPEGCAIRSGRRFGWSFFCVPPTRNARCARREAGSAVRRPRALGLVAPFRAPKRALINESDQAERAISTGKLNALLRFHTRPIDVVVFHGSSGSSRFEVGFPLRCFQRLSRPCLATRLRGWRHDRSTRGTSTPVLSY